MKRVVGRTASMLGWIRTVPIDCCVHYCGFRYGASAFNPYENYIVGLSQDADRDELRARFTDFLQHYRPRNINQALGIELSQDIPLWAFPWRRRLVRKDEAWKARPDDIVDVMTYYCPEGVPAAGVLREFGWLEGAWRNIRVDGYHPARYSYVVAIELRNGPNSRFLLTDGNHRVSALSALGKSSVAVLRPPWAIVDRSKVRDWPHVRAGLIETVNAVRIFDAFFAGNAVPFRTAEPAPIAY